MSEDGPGLLTALLLAMVQGATEFLPVSSSGHLAAMQLLWPKLAYPGVSMELALHLGTTAAVLIYYRQLIVTLVTRQHNDPEATLGLTPRDWRQALLVGSLPTAVIGLAGADLIRLAFDDLRWIAAGLAITSVALMSTRGLSSGTAYLGIGRALLIGISQGVAIFPGVSRSGITISVALLLGLPHRQAITYSLLLSIPAVLGATLVDSMEMWRGNFTQVVLFGHLTFATLSASAVGYQCIGLVHRAARAEHWHLFAWYCWPVAATLAFAVR